MSLRINGIHVNGSSPPVPPLNKIPSSIIIVGLGVFGVSTALAISSRPEWSNTHITVIDASATSTSPNPTGSSVDHSRIVRPDYGNLAYAQLAVEAQKLWRDTTSWGGGGRYHQVGLALISRAGDEEIVRKTLDNVRSLASRFPDLGRIQVLENAEEVAKVTGVMLKGDWGYVNWGSGWADAGASIKYALSRLDTSRVRVMTGEVARLVEEGAEDRCKIVGVQMSTGEYVNADLTVLATGAWTNKLVDLRGRLEATGQPMAYLDLLDHEQGLLKDKPIVLDMSTGLYVIPQNDHLLKIGRHSYGYSNPRCPTFEGGESVTVNLPPEKWVDLPEEAKEEFRAALRHGIPSIDEREFKGRRVCWYTDTLGLAIRLEAWNMLISFFTDNTRISWLISILRSRVFSLRRAAAGMGSSSSLSSENESPMPSRDGSMWS